MTAVGNTPAPAPSPAEAATVAQFGMFEAEERVEQVARAIRSEWLRILGDWADDWADASAETRDHYRRLAAAAIAAMPASPTASSCPTCVREGGPYRCCPHCVDDPDFHKALVRNHHDLPCSTCVAETYR